jgi:thiamine-phosphate pyrophosphorylase/hydroxymethylpyrimidine kinase/phosphomethylpyrimidine kinase/thiamine-phosphate diphosphorylase
VSDWSLYLVTDPKLGGGAEQVPDIVNAAVRGGVSVVQLRDKDASDEVFARRAAQLKDTVADRVPLFVNDRVETAVGLHDRTVGRDPGPPRCSRP